MKREEKYSKRFLQNEIRQILGSQRNNEFPELNLYQKAIIYKYSNDGYETLNEYLRAVKDKKNTEFGDLLNSALSRLPNYEGLVYRSVNLTKDELVKYSVAFKLNQPISENAFVSTSKSRLIASEYGGNTFFRIYSKTGKGIEKIAKFGMFDPPNEKEVLFKSGRKFKVLEVTQQEIYSLITMEEI